MKKLVRATGTLGTAAAIGLTVTACSKPVPAPEVPPEAAAEPNAAEPAAEAQPAEAAEPTEATEPGAAPEGPDCDGEDRFTEACGYASPTKYAVLDPSGIRNV